MNYTLLICWISTVPLYYLWLCLCVYTCSFIFSLHYMKVKFFSCWGLIFLPFHIFLHLLVLGTFVCIQTLWEPVLMQVLKWCCNKFFFRIWWYHSKNSKFIVACPQSLNSFRHPYRETEIVTNENSFQFFSWKCLGDSLCILAAFHGWNKDDVS